MYKKIGLSLISFVALLLVILTVTKQVASNTSTTKKVASTMPSFNKKEFSNDDPTSIWVIADKKRPLNPSDYQPSDLTTPNVALRLGGANNEMKMRAEASSALEKMFDSASKDSIKLLLSSGFRSYSVQKSLYNQYVSQKGQTAADSDSARPGFSEHQTGLAVDVSAQNHKCQVEQCFAETPEGIWLAANAYRFGFVIRYQNGTEATVGYIFEPWHLRYVGTKLSNEIHRLNNVPLETFFSLPAAPDY